MYAGHGILALLSHTLISASAADHLINSKSNTNINSILIQQDSTRFFSLPCGTNVNARPSLLFCFVFFIFVCQYKFHVSLGARFTLHSATVSYCAQLYLPHLSLAP